MGAIKQIFFCLLLLQTDDSYKYYDRYEYVGGKNLEFL